MIKYIYHKTPFIKKYAVEYLVNELATDFDTFFISVFLGKSHLPIKYQFSCCFHWNKYFVSH